MFRIFNYKSFVILIIFIILSKNKSERKFGSRRYNYSIVFKLLVLIVKTPKNIFSFYNNLISLKYNLQ